MINASLRQLRLFAAIARLGKLTLAADAQAISQSAASQALRELEQALGYALFHRLGRELVITDAGRTVLPRVEQLLQLADSLGDPSADAVGGPLRIAASVTIASYLLPRFLAAFIQQYPQVVPEVRIANTANVLRELEQGWAHIGLIEGPAHHRQLTIAAWRTDRLAVFCHPAHPLAQQATADFESLATQRWIVREVGSGTRRVLDQAAQQAGLRWLPAMELNRQEAIKQSVKAGLGIGCLSELAVAQEIARGELCVLHTPLNLERMMSLVYWSDHPTPLTRRVCEELRQWSTTR